MIQPNKIWTRKRSGEFEGHCCTPSSMPGYQFSIFLTGRWKETDSRNKHHNPKDVARDYALSVTQSISEKSLLTETTQVESRINSLLGLPVDLPRAPVRLLWVRAQVFADPLQQKSVMEQLQREHSYNVQEEQDQRKLQRARFLRNALLTDPSVAVSQWFIEHPESVESGSLHRVEKVIEEVTAYAPDTSWVKAAKILQDFVRGLPQDARRHLVETLMGVCDRYGYPKHSERFQNEVLDHMPPQESHEGNIN